MANYPKGGALFLNKKKQGRQPDYNGNLELEPDVVRYIAECYQNGQEPKLRLAAWVKETPRAGRFFSIKAQKPYDGGQSEPARGPLDENGTSYIDDDIPF